MKTARMRMLVLGVATASCLLAGFAFLRAHQVRASAPANAPAPQGPEVQTARVVVGSITHHVQGIGHIVTAPGGTVETSFQEAGKIATLEVTTGQTVRSGQVLARLDTRRLALKVVEAQAALAGANAAIVADQARVHGDRTALRREEALLANGVTAQKDVDAASQQLALDRATLTADQAKLDDPLVPAQKARAGTRVGATRQESSAGLELARTALAYAVLRAPISGVVTAIAKNPGEWANPGDTVATIVDPRSADLVVSVPAAAAFQIAPGDLVLTGNATASVLHVIAPLDPTTQMAKVIVKFQGPAPAPIGSVLAADILTGIRHDVTIVPISAVVQDPVTQAFTVFVKQASGSFRPVTVKPGWTDGSREEVQSSQLVAQRMVATYGSYELLAAQ